MEKITLSNGISFQATDIASATFYPKGSVLLGGVGDGAPELREVATLHITLKNGQHITSSDDNASVDADRIEAGHGLVTRARTAHPSLVKD